MSRNSEPIEITVAVHFDPPRGQAILVSDTGEAKDAKWIPRSLIASFHLTGKTTRGIDNRGQVVVLPMASLELPEWKAKQEGLI